MAKYDVDGDGFAIHVCVWKCSNRNCKAFHGNHGILHMPQAICWDSDSESI